MITLPYGKKYKIVYLDTNAISEFINNTKYFGKNFLLNYANGEYCFATSVFNVLELNETGAYFKNKFINNFGLIPLGICQGKEQILEYEKNNVDLGNNIFMFAIGIKPLFNGDINDLFYEINKTEMQKIINQRNNIIDKEINEWKFIRREKSNPRWQKKFDVNILETMNAICKNYENYEKVNNLGKYKSLEISAYIRNLFIHNTNNMIDRNSIIDSYNVCIFPYVDVYITERTVGNWLKSSKDKFSYLKEKHVFKISEFFDKQNS